MLPWFHPSAFHCPLLPARGLVAPMSQISLNGRSPFSLEGRFLGFVLKDGYRVKGINLSTAAGEQYIKLSKEARAACKVLPAPGCWVRVSGVQKQDESGTVKLKALSFGVTNPTSTSCPAAPVPSAKSAATILFCNKSDCCKKGGRAVLAALQETLDDRQLTDQVSIKPTGCMKRCKAGPNLVMPDKTRYCGITAAEVPGIVDKHFSSETVSDVRQPALQTVV